MDVGKLPIHVNIVLYDCFLWNIFSLFLQITDRRIREYSQHNACVYDRKKLNMEHVN